MSAPALEGRVALVTGAGGGIGRAICGQLAGAGARVFGLDNNADAAARTQSKLRTAGLEVTALCVDITVPEQVEEAVARASRDTGAVDIAVNNAGVITFGSFLDVAASEWDRIMAVNVTGTLLIAQRCLARMRPRGRGVIINIGSVAGVQPLINRAHYATSKAAVHAVTVELARETAEEAIRVYGIAPKAIMSGMNTVRYSAADGVTPLNTGVWLSDETQIKANVSTSLVGRLGAPDDIAKVVRALAIGAPRSLNGRILNVDGGYLAGDAITP